MSMGHKYHTYDGSNHMAFMIFRPVVFVCVTTALLHPYASATWLWLLLVVS